ncbi:MULTISPECIES: type II secretion system protein N [Candidatus Fukatsuia]|uniref:type II secretion system protein N n=1 Tax=Candidatus Fukatsuia TaxID=1927833 RepID=UPI000933B368|nr:type II secretion system protein N [Candidatus Fukatsuia symbiotica]
MLFSLITRVRIASFFSINRIWFALETLLICLCTYYTITLFKDVINYHYKNEIPELHFDIATSHIKRLNNTLSREIAIKELGCFQLATHHTHQIVLSEIEEITDEKILYNAKKYNGESKLVGIVKSTNPLNSISIIERDNEQSSYFIRDEIKKDKAIIVRIFNDRIIIKNDIGYFFMVLD